MAGTKTTIGTKHQGLHTAIGLLILGVMLFPVYWMVNSSLQHTGNTLTGELSRSARASTATARPCSDQGGNLVTSLMVALGTRGLQPRRRRARGLRAGPVQVPLAELRAAWPS